MEVAKRLKQFRKFLHMTQDEISRVLGVSKPAYVRYESGDRTPPLSMLDILHHKYKMNINWFIAGKGDMLTVDDKSAKGVMDILQITEPEKYIEYWRMIELMMNDPIVEKSMLLLAHQFKQMQEKEKSEKQKDK